MKHIAHKDWTSFLCLEIMKRLSCIIELQGDSKMILKYRD